MSTLDKINRQGKSKLFFAGQGVKNSPGTKNWVMKREHLSPAYTTNWADILKVK
jgi:DNA polymerase V